MWRSFISGLRSLQMWQSISARVKRGFARYAKSDSGMPAIEFAFVAPVFFLLLFVVIETGIMYFVEYTLQASVQEASRLVRTGQAQAGNFTAANFKTKVCKTMGILVDCEGGVTVYVASAANFTALKPLIPTYDKIGPKVDGSTNAGSFVCGAPAEAVAIIATYDWKIIMKFAMSFMANFDGNNKRRLVGLAMFQNEPFPASGACVALPAAI
jgi:Flp pilus assembly protein TadG